MQKDMGIFPFETQFSFQDGCLLGCCFMQSGTVLMALTMKAASASETSANFHQTTRRNIPGDSHRPSFISFPFLLFFLSFDFLFYLFLSSFFLFTFLLRFLFRPFYSFPLCFFLS
jgi:hypothetical protein